MKAGVRRCMAVYGGVEQNSGGVCGCARGMGSGGGLVRRCADCAALWSTDGAMTGIRGHRTNVTEFQQCMLCVGVWRCVWRPHTPSGMTLSTCHSCHHTDCDCIRGTRTIVTEFQYMLFMFLAQYKHSATQPTQGPSFMSILYHFSVLVLMIVPERSCLGT